MAEAATSNRLKEVEGKIANLIRALEAGVMSMEVVNNLKRLEQEKAVLSSCANPVSSPPQVDVDDLRTFMRGLDRAIAGNKPSEIKRFIGQCVEVMTLHPDEVKVTIQQKTPGIVSPALAYRVVAGARFEAIHDKLENWRTVVWDLPTRGRRSDLGRAAAAGR